MSRIRAAESGPFLEGSAVGDLLRWDGREWQRVPTPGGLLPAGLYPNNLLVWNGASWVPVNPSTLSQGSLVAPYDSIIIGTGANALGGGLVSSEFLTQSQQYRIRQAGTIHTVQFFMYGDLATLSDFRVRIWRPSNADGTGTVNLVGESENITPRLASYQINTIRLANPIVGVAPGDLHGVRWLSGILPQVRAWITIPNSQTFFAFDVPAWVDGHVLGGASVPTSAWPCLMYMTSPDLVLIGDSITQGVPLNYAFTQTVSNVTDLVDYWGAIVANGRGWSYQNMGHGTDSMIQIGARFIPDVVTARPGRYLLEGGINDVVLLGSPAVDVIARYQQVLSDARAASLTGFLTGILPDSNTTNAQARIIDTVNAWLLANAPTYGALYIGAPITNAVGQFRVGGDPGNVWDLKPIYTGDGVHLNAAGQAVMAAAVLGAIP